MQAPQSMAGFFLFPDSAELRKQYILIPVNLHFAG